MMNFESRIRTEKLPSSPRKGRVDGMDVLARVIILPLIVPIILIELAIFLPIYVISRIFDKMGRGQP